MISSPSKTKALKFVSDESSQIKTGRKVEGIKSTMKEKIVVDIVDLLSCEKCEFDAECQSELNKHNEFVHGQEIRVRPIIGIIGIGIGISVFFRKSVSVSV